MVPEPTRAVSPAMTPSYTRTAFLSELARRGYRRTARWHEEWIGLGLLDRGVRHGREKATWPQEQMELAASLLRHVQKGAHLPSLSNIVVCIWLWWGDGYVPCRQVPRALKTWLDGEQEPAEKHVRASASELVEKIKHPKGRGKRRLVRALVDLTYKPQADQEQLRELFDDVFDPDRTGKVRGPAGAEISSDLYFGMVKTRIEGRAQLRSFTQAEYRAARDLYRWSRTEYAKAQPNYARDPDLGRLYEVPDLNEVANSACSDLFTCLALLRKHGQSFLHSR